MAIYIKSAEAITSQNTFNRLDVLQEVVALEKEYYSYLTPDFKQYLDAKLLRRMSKILKASVATAVVCLENAKISLPDAVLVGTGLGCIEDTSKFLNQIIEHDEQLLNPTPFIQSTHNTISGQIALILKCKKHNLTFTQKTISFETALLEAMMLLQDNDAQHVLVGGVDEIIDETYKLINISGCVHQEDAIKFGEGATFFVLSSEKENANVELKDLAIFHSINNEGDLNNKVGSFLMKHNLTFNDIDFVVSGINQTERFDKLYTLLNSWFTDSSLIKYKHLIGEYDTASSFGMFLANSIIANNKIPESVMMNKKEKKEYKRGIVFNYSKNKDFTLSLLSKC